MNLSLSLEKINPDVFIKITGSKSETNRLLLLKSLFPNIVLENISNSDDSQIIQEALVSNEKIINVHHAGTAMRFLTAYFAVSEGKEITLTGSERMQERPIEVLVTALRNMGAQIEYENKDGYPPIRIRGKKIISSKITIPANISSQYISALLLVAPRLENGIELTLDGIITSSPYIKMTLELLKELGINTLFEENIIRIFPKDTISEKTLTVESDWSSASYFYSIVALSPKNTKIKLSSYKKNSLQGDSKLVEIYKKLGVESYFENNEIHLIKKEIVLPDYLELDLSNTPDIAQTIAVSCFGLGISCNLTGLHTLKIKETDRLEALKTELTKLGADIIITHNSLILASSQNINQNISIATYNDHRMAMAFATLSTKVPIIIEDSEVVSKSYPSFWEDMKKTGFLMRNC